MQGKMKQCDNCKDFVTRYEYQKNQGLCNECVDNPKPKQKGQTMDEEKTIVIFRMWYRGKFVGDITALFPDIEAGTYRHGKLCQSYQHVGQHGPADYDYVIQCTRPAKESEYKDLFDELTKIGYNIIVRKRWTRY